MEESTIRQLSEELGCSKQNVSYHLKKLTEGLSEEERKRIVFQDGRKTFVTRYGLSLVKERIAGNDKALAAKAKQNMPNVKHQKNGKDLSHLTNSGQRNLDNHYEKMLSDRDLEIQRLKAELEESRRQAQIERENYMSEVERGRQERLSLQKEQTEHTENLLALFSKAYEKQQDTVDEFFSKTTELIEEQQKMIGDLAKTTQRLQENQQQLALMDRHPNSFELASLKQRVNDLENVKKGPAVKAPSWANTVLCIKAVWSILKGN